MNQPKKYVPTKKYMWTWNTKKPNKEKLEKEIWKKSQKQYPHKI